VCTGCSSAPRSASTPSLPSRSQAPRPSGCSSAPRAYADLLARALGLDAGDVTTDGWTDACTDAVVVWGDRDAVRARVVEHLDAGADEVILSPYGCGNDPDVNLDEALEVLGDIARS
jgi:hypothetical protein